jgi:secreted trypsin-like serine protease
MTPGAIRVSIAIAIIGWAGPMSAHADNALRLLPPFRSIYQTKIGEIIAGNIPQVFLGTASVAPDRGFPWMVSLQVKGPQSAIGHFCGGIAVDRTWVLTAAHCVAISTAAGDRGAIRPPDPENVQILVRSNVLSLGGQVKSVARIVIHPEFQVTPQRVPENDLALLKIADAPDLTPLRLAESRATGFLQAGSKVGIAGWGTSSFDTAGAVSNNLLFAFVEVVERSRCNEPTIYDGAVDDSMFCAGLGVADACQGDSGGPAVGYSSGLPYLVGITSWGLGCTSKSYPGVYVNVAKFGGWINETIAASK